MSDCQSSTSYELAFVWALEVIHQSLRSTWLSLLWGASHHEGGYQTREATEELEAFMEDSSNRKCKSWLERHASYSGLLADNEGGLYMQALRLLLEWRTSPSLIYSTKCNSFVIPAPEPESIWDIRVLNYTSIFGMTDIMIICFLSLNLWFVSKYIELRMTRIWWMNFIYSPSFFHTIISSKIDSGSRFAAWNDVTPLGYSFNAFWITKLGVADQSVNTHS